MPQNTKSKRRGLVGLIAIIVLPVWTVIAIGVVRDYHPLPGGYYIWRSNSSTIDLVPPEKHYGNPTYVDPRMVVGNKIVKTAVVGGHILGEVVESPQASNSSPEVVGYFVVNITTGDAVLGMSEEQLSQWIANRGPALAQVKWRRVGW